MARASAARGLPRKADGAPTGGEYWNLRLLVPWLVQKNRYRKVAFDSIHASKRHKSGLAMRFPRISRIRTDKPAHEADTIAGLERLAN